MRVKSIYFAICFLFSTTVLFSQQRPHYTQYILNNYILNPALSGIENYTDIKLSVRTQWVGLEGAPKTMYFSVQAPLGKSDYRTTATSYEVPGENPRGTAYWDAYTVSKPHHGIGFFAVNDKTGNYNHLTVAASYAYHIGLTPQTSLAAGFSIGVSRYSHNNTASVFNYGDLFDNALGNADIDEKFKPDIGAGLWLYSAKYFIGLSAQNIIRDKVKFSQTNGIALIPHIFATCGYRFMIGEDVNALPSVMFKNVSGSPTVPQFDLNIKLQYRDQFWAGGSYRIRNGYAAMAGINIANSFNLGYAYDFTTTQLNTVSKGTHEIMIGFIVGNKYGDTCPRNVW